MKKYLLIILPLLIISILIYFRPFLLKGNKPEVGAQVLDREIVLEIEGGQTFSFLTTKVGLDHKLMSDLLLVSKDIYDLVTIKVGQEIIFIFDSSTQEFKQLIYSINSEEELYIYQNELNEWRAERKDIEYEIRLKTVEGVIESSLYESALGQK